MVVRFFARKIFWGNTGNLDYPGGVGMGMEQLYERSYDTVTQKITADVGAVMLLMSHLRREHGISIVEMKKIFPRMSYEEIESLLRGVVPERKDL